jgi:high affinity sulfate transporter 1
MQGILPIDRTSISGEIVAGLTLAALAIPEVMGYATLAGMPVVTGLYTLFLPMLVFGILGSSRHLVVGADSATAVVMAAGLAGMASTGSDEYIALAGLMALIAGVLLIVARLIKLGFIADFLSRTVLIGFLTGVGIQVACGQVGGMLGIPKGDGVTIRGHTFDNTIAVLISTLEDLGDVSWSTVGVSAGVLGTMLVIKRFAKRVPGALIAVVGAIFVSWQFDLSSHGVSTLGSLSGGLPPFGIPDVSWSDIPPLLGTAVSIVVIILAQSAATSRAYAAKYNDHFDENVDLVGLGASSIAAGLSGTFVVNGSPTKTQMVDGAGGRSQLAQLATSVIVVVVLLFLTGPIEYMPNAVLASVVFLIGLELVDIAGMRRVLVRRSDEFIVAAVVALTVVIAGVEQGIVIGIVASIIDHLRRSYRPSSAVLEPGTDGIWRSVELRPGSRSLPGLAIYRFSGSLYFANANHFLEEIESLVDDPAPLRWLCVDASTMPDIDYSGGETIRQLHGVLDERGVTLVIAGASESVERMLGSYDLIELLGPDGVQDSIDDAVGAYGRLVNETN